MKKIFFRSRASSSRQSNIVTTITSLGYVSDCEFRTQNNPNLALTRELYIFLWVLNKKSRVVRRFDCIALIIPYHLYNYIHVTRGSLDADGRRHCKSNTQTNFCEITPLPAEANETKRIYIMAICLLHLKHNISLHIHIGAGVWKIKNIFNWNVNESSWCRNQSFTSKHNNARVNLEISFHYDITTLAKVVIWN